MNNIYILNDQKNLSVIQSASLGQTCGIISSGNPIAFCFSNQYLVYQKSQSEGELPLVDIRETLSTHIKQGLIEASAMDLLR